MSRLSLVHMVIGFLVVFISAAGGAFVAFDITQAFNHDQALLSSWQMLLAKSAHAHFNLFGYLHVLFGLTLPYSVWSLATKKWQFVGLLAGTLAMGPGLLLRSWFGVPQSLDGVEISLGILISCALLSILLHAFGIASKIFARY